MFLRRKKIQAGIIFGHLLVRQYSLFTIPFLLAILIACSLSGNIKAQGIQGKVVESFSRQGIPLSLFFLNRFIGKINLAGI
jgi:hypothetical protein